MQLPKYLKFPAKYCIYTIFNSTAPKAIAAEQEDNINKTSNCVNDI